jgi:hypothetical protein
LRVGRGGVRSAENWKREAQAMKKDRRQFLGAAAAAGVMAATRSVRAA